MKDDLISREAAINFANEQMVKETGAYSKGRNAALLVMKSALNNPNAIPSVPAVPLDKLCEWLNVHCGRPNYCNDRLCGKCSLDGEGFEYETCWKTLLTEWMEEQDAADRR